MKKTILLSLLAIPTIALCQTDTLSYAKMQETSFKETAQDNSIFKVYVAKDGSVLKAGDRLTFGMPTGSTITETTASAVPAFSIETYKAKSTSTKNFQYLVQGYATPENISYSGLSYLKESDQNKEATVVEIRLNAEKVKGGGTQTKVVVFTQVPNAPKALRNFTILDYDRALETGEVINPNAALTRNQAIAKLKESKELMDLGVIKQADYDGLRTKLTPIIVASK